MKQIDCEVAQVFDRDELKTGFSIRPLDMSDVNVEFFNSFEKSKWNEKYKSISVSYFHNKKPNPDWLLKDTQISVGILNKNGYCNIDPKTIKVLKLADGTFEGEIEELDDDFVAEELEKELQSNKQEEKKDQPPKTVSKNDRKKERIDQLVENYASVFVAVNGHKSLVSLETGLKKDIATHINITLTNEGY
tara:strand:- start:778 stop:1350 length:573 start_codon:yes stop_codon:yes gene_type:complete